MRPSSTTSTRSSAPPRPTCPGHMVWPPLGGGRNRRWATPTRAPPRRWAWSRPARTRGPTRPATAGTRKNTEGVPEEMFDRLQASGFTHFQQSGTGAIRKYYNYVRVTPMVQPLDDAGRVLGAARRGGRGRLLRGHPGHRGALRDHRGQQGRRAPVHVPASTATARVVVDMSLRRAGHRPRPDGAAARPGGEHGPRPGAGHRGDGGRPAVGATSRWTARAGGRCSGTTGGSSTAAPGSTSTASGTPRCGRSACSSWARPGPARPSRCGWASRCAAASRPGRTWPGSAGRSTAGLRRGPLPHPGPLARAHRPGPGRGRHAGPPHGVCATSLYHSLIKPCIADDESPFWPDAGPYAFDVCTMWDIYKTQLPLLAAIAPDRATDLLESLIRVCEEEGNFPIGYRMARGADRFFRQASALAHTALADAHALGRPGLDWTWALVHMVDDLRRMYGEDFFEHGVVHPITHTLDLAYAHYCTAQVARALNDRRLADDLERRSRQLGERLRPGHRAAARLGVLRGRQVELLVPAAARHGRPDRAGRRRRGVRRHAGPVLRVRRRAGEAARPAPRRRPRWRPDTR